MNVAPMARRTLRILAFCARAVATGMRRTAQTAWTHRRTVGAVAVRIAWWASLWLSIEHARALFDVSAPLDPGAMLTGFGLGLALCWLVTVFAASKHLRYAAVALGTVHGTLGLFLWTITGAG